MFSYCSPGPHCSLPAVTLATETLGGGRLRPFRLLILSFLGWPSLILVKRLISVITVIFFLRTIYIFKLYLPSLRLQNYFPSKNIILFDQMIFSSWHEGKVITIEIVCTLMSQEKPICVGIHEKDDLGLHTLLIPSLILILKSDERVRYITFPGTSDPGQ